MKREFRIAASLITVAACGFFVFRLAGSAKDIGHLVQDIRLGQIAPVFVASSLLFALIYPLTGAVFPRLLSSTTPVLSRSTSIGILATGQLARYLPGNVGQHLARGGMLAARGFPMATVVPALFFEAILSVMAACIVGGVALAFFPFASALPVGWEALVGLLALGALMLCAIRFWPRIVPRLARRHPALATSPMISPATAMRCIGVYAFNYVFVGLGLYLIARVMSPLAGSPGIFIGAFALSWIVGFLAPGLPAGLGVREGVLVALLGPVLGTPTAVTLAALHRLSTTLGDALAAALGAGLLWRARQKS